jgi:hypothetical protein
MLILAELTSHVDAPKSHTNVVPQIISAAFIISITHHLCLFRSLPSKTVWTIQEKSAERIPDGPQ